MSGIRNRLIQLLGGYTKQDCIKIGARSFDDYCDAARLGWFIPADEQLEIKNELTGGKFIVRQCEGLSENGGTIIKLDNL